MFVGKLHSFAAFTARTQRSSNYISLINLPSVFFAHRYNHNINMPDYPGLGLPLRHNEQDNYGFYPIGAHGSCYGSESDLLAVRELAMMMVMDRLTDKPEWHKKVFDDTIIAKWREEALAIPDEELWKLSVSGKAQQFEEGGVTLRDDWFSEQNGKPPIENIMDEDAFDFVRRNCVTDDSC
jgi:hypothetical protein